MKDSKFNLSQNHVKQGSYVGRKSEIKIIDSNKKTVIKKS